MGRLLTIVLVFVLLLSGCWYSKEDYDAAIEEAYWKGYYEAEEEHKYDYENGDFDGYMRGYDEAASLFDEYHSDGWHEGYNEGKSEGYEKGFDNGYKEGKNDGQVEGYEDGYEDGYYSALEDYELLG